MNNAAYGIAVYYIERLPYLSVWFGSFVHRCFRYSIITALFSADLTPGIAIVVVGFILVGFLIHSSRDFSSHTGYGTPEIFGVRPKIPCSDGPVFLKPLSNLWQCPHCLRVSDSGSSRFAPLFSPEQADNAAISISGRILINM